MKAAHAIRNMRAIAQSCADDAAINRTRFHGLAITAAFLSVILLLGVADNTLNGDNAKALICGLAATFMGIHGIWSCVAARCAHNTFMRVRQQALDKATAWERLSK